MRESKHVRAALRLVNDALLSTALHSGLQGLQG